MKIFHKMIKMINGGRSQGPLVSISNLNDQSGIIPISMIILDIKLMQMNNVRKTKI